MLKPSSRSRPARARRSPRRLPPQSRPAPAHPAKHSPPTVPVTVINTPAAAAEDEHRGRAANAGTDRTLSERHHRDQHGDGIEERGIDGDRKCRSAAIRAATPSCPLITLPSTCMLDAR
jgi:hypothetical protein